MRLLKRLIFYPVLYLILCLVLYFNQRSLIYYPTARIQHHFDTEYLQIDNDKIEVIKLNKGKDKALLYFGGNAEILAYTALDFESLFPNHTVYMMNYPGYGNSTGQPNESGIYKAAQRLFIKSKQQHHSHINYWA